MAAPLPTGSSLQALPEAPRINPMMGVAAVDPMAAMSKGIDFAGQFARLGQLRSKIELEDAQRKADMAKSKASLLEADLIQRDLEDKFNIEKTLREQALIAQAQSLETAKTQGALANVQLGEAQGAAAFNKDLREAAGTQLRSLDLPASPTAAASAAPAAPVADGAVIVPFKPNAAIEEWIKPQVAAKILETRRPVMSVSALAKELGVKQEKRSFVDANTGTEHEVDVLTGPAGEIFKVSEPRFVKASQMQSEVDKKFADDVADFVSGGAVKAAANIAKLDGAITALKDSGTVGASGPIVGLIPEKVRKPFTTDKTMAIQKDVEQVVQESLKAILGAQFAQKEAEQLLSRSFDTSLSEEANAARLEALRDQLKNALAAKTTAVDYFQKRGTLAGSKYIPALPTGSDTSKAAPAATEGEIRVDPATGKKYRLVNGVVTEVR
jgi:hypothetical protein